MYRRTVLRSIPSWRPMAVRLSPCRCSSMIMTSSPTPTTAVAPVRQEQHGWTRNEVGSFRRPLLGSIHRPARHLEESRVMERSEILTAMAELKLYGMKAAFDEII